MKVTVVVITKNERDSIGACLASIGGLDQIIVVDSGSTDGTLEYIARNHPEVEVVATSWQGFCVTKNIGIQQARNDWILWLDADELLPPETCDFILMLDESQKPMIAGFSFPRRNHFLGRWVRHSGWYPNRVLRLFNRRFAGLDGAEIHETVIVNQSSYRVEPLSLHIDHFSYRSLHQYFAKMNYYGELSAQKISHRRILALYLLVGPFLTFIRCYFLRLGFLDGAVGLIISVGTAYSNFIKYTNLYFLNRSGVAGGSGNSNPQLVKS